MDTLKNVVHNADIFWLFYFIKDSAPSLSRENKYNLGDNLNNFSFLQTV